MYRNAEPEDDYLFCVEGNKICVATLKKDISSYNLSRGVTKTSSHLYRHTWANLEIVRNYVNMFQDDFTADYDKYNPLEQFNKKSNTLKMR